MSVSSRRLPITLLAGFFGAGKTSVLHHTLAEHKGGSLALILVGNTEFHFDAGIIRGVIASVGRVGDQILELRDDQSQEMFHQLTQFVKEAAQANRFERIIIELSGWMDPTDLAVRLQYDEEEGSLVQVDNIVTVLDGLRYWREVVERAVKPRDQTMSAIPEIQITNSSTVILHKIDLLGAERLSKCGEFFHLAHPAVSLIETRFGKVEPEILCPPPGKYSVEIKRSDYTPLLEILSYAAGFLYRARRPFHPQRFWDVWFSDWPDIVRCKGFFWLATRMEFVGGLSQAGAAYSVGIAGKWWATVPPEDWPKDGEPRLRIDANWKEPFGDRRQEFILVGKREGAKIATDAFDRCLLTEEEMAAGPEAWKQYADPFPEWKMEEESS
jgi:G3E family GTPase